MWKIVRQVLNFSLCKIVEIKICGKTRFENLPRQLFHSPLLLGLSKGDARVEIWASFFFFFFVQPQFAIKSLIRMRDDLTLMCAWHGVMADEERFMR